MGSQRRSRSTFLVDLGATRRSLREQLRALDRSGALTQEDDEAAAQARRVMHGILADRERIELLDERRLLDWVRRKWGRSES